MHKNKKFNPWKRLSSKQVYKNSFVSLREDQVINPNGSLGVYAVYNIRYAVGIVALDSNNDIYLVGQYRYAIDEYAWEIVEGGADEGESPLLAAQRELQEEVGMRAKNWQTLGPEIHISNCHTNEKAQAFLATDLEFIDANRDSSEILEIKKISFSEALDMIKKGQIKDALSLIALERAKNYMNNT